MNHDYTALDAAILAAIAERQPATFSQLFTRPVRTHSAELEHTQRHGDGWRVVDRRLQALRKSGRIKYQRKPEIVRMPVELRDAERDCARDLAKTQAANDEGSAPAAA